MLTVTEEYVKAAIGERRRDSNKGDNGKGLLLAGSTGFSGAALMAAAAALRAGIGTLKLYCPSTICGAMYALPEAMTVPFDGADWNSYSEPELDDLLAVCTCAGAGPGMGKTTGGEAAIRAVLESGLPAVIDADGLNMLARLEKPPLNGNVVLTPHPGEMGRLTGKSVSAILSDMEDCAGTYAQQHSCTVLLKGAESIIAAPDGRTMKNASGNAGLAKGGSGDVLTGIVLALLGQGLSPFDAACCGSYLLGASADTAMRLLRERMLITRDVVSAVSDTLDNMNLL